MDLKAINSLLNKKSEFGSILKDSDFGISTEYIDTGNYSFNAQISGSIKRGVGNSLSYLFSGEPETGKTYLCLNVMRNAVNKLGYFAIYYDSEGSINEQKVLNFGIDTSMVRHEPIKTFTQIIASMSTLLSNLVEAKKNGETIPKMIIFIDSLSAINSEIDIEKSEAGEVNKMPLQSSKDIARLYRMITVDAKYLKIPVISTAHITKSMSMYESDSSKGGLGKIYLSDVCIMLKKTKLKEQEDNDKLKKIGMKKSGYIVTAHNEKNREARDFTNTFYISTLTGMNPYIGLQKYLDYDKMGIGPGVLEEEEIESVVLDENGNPIVSNRGKEKKEIKKTGNFVYVHKETKDLANQKKYAVKHLGKTIDIKELYKPDVFTDNVLTQLDENVIKPLYRFTDGIKTNFLDVESTIASALEEESNSNADHDFNTMFSDAQ